MSLSLSAQFATLQNVTLPLIWDATGATLRCGAAATGTLGSLTVTGDSNVTWGLALNPAWVTLAVSASTPTQITLSFANAVYQRSPYAFYVYCKGTTETVFYPILLEVRQPFTLTSPATLTIPSYDYTVADTVIQAQDSSGSILTGLRLVPPTNVPAGFNVLSSDETSITLRVDQPSASDNVGGLKTNTGSPTTNQLALSVYKDGTMYDTPDRSYTANVGVESLSYKQGILDVALSLSYSTVSNAVSVTAAVDFIAGAAVPVTYSWSYAGGSATGTVASGGGIHDKFVIWSPVTSGTATFTFRVLNATTGAVLGVYSITGVAVAPSGSWQSTAAIKALLNTNIQTATSGTTAQITVSTPAGEFAGGETYYGTVTVSPAGSVEGTAVLGTTSFTLTAAQASQNLTVTLPAADWNHKWQVHIALANATSGATRTGQAYAVFSSTSKPTLTIGESSGQALTANNGVAFTLPAFTVVNSSSTPVAAALQLQGAPNGLYINSNKQLTGTVVQPGVYTFYVLANATGYAQAKSALFTLTVAQVQTPQVVTNVVASAAALPDGQSYTVQWGTNGAGTDLFIQQNASVIDVFGTQNVTLTQIGTSVLSVYGYSYAGYDYSIPQIVVSSSITSQAKLLNGPALAVIDANQKLTLNWHPATVNGSYQAYRAFNIWLTMLPSGSPQLQTLPTGAITGLEPAGATPDSRIFTTTVPVADYALDMQALTSDSTVALNADHWDAAHNFPTALTVSQVALSETSLDLNEPLTLTLDPAYIGADSWQVTFDDGTTTGWLPLSRRLATKSFSTPGTQNITVTVQCDYSTANPGVKLQRQFTTSVFVLNQQYAGGSGSQISAGATGFGGDVMFEITNDFGVSTTVVTPFAVVVRSLVRDTVTNEFKLMVATARGTDSSSLLGTMALDVFPLVGRPKTKDLLEIPTYLQTGVAASTPTRIGTALLPNFIVGKSMTDLPMQVLAGTGLSPYNWYADGLPDGIIMSLDGTLSGTPTKMGTYQVTFAVIDSSAPAFIDEVTLTANVVSDLTIQTSVIPGAFVSTPYTTALQLGGGLAPYTWSIASGALPLGLSVDPNTGILSGTPVTYNSTTDFGKVFAFTVQVTDSIGAITAKAFTTTLGPAPLQFGPLDQKSLFAESKFRVIAPIFGGNAPYTLTSFKDDGVVGSGLNITGPDRVHLVAGITSPALEIDAADEVAYPVAYPAGVALQLTASGGTQPYHFLLDTSATTTLPGASIVGNVLLGYPAGDGTYATGVLCVDALGHTVTHTVRVRTQLKNESPFSVRPVQVNMNSSTDPANWTITPISALPDALQNQPYAPAAGSYFGMALYSGSTIQISQNTGANLPISFEVRSGALPAGLTTVSGNGFTGTGDYSGIVLFNVGSGSYPTVLGSSSFEAEFSNIYSGSSFVESVSRQSVTVRASGSGTTPVVNLDNSIGAITLDMAYVGGTVALLPLVAEGGTGPYKLAVQNGTTLPNVAISAINGVPVVTCSNLSVGSFLLVTNATDANGIVSSPKLVSITVTQTVPAATHVVASNLPTYVYAGRAIPANVYYVESDNTANWTATGLPAGVSLSSGSGKRVYLTGTPTATGTFNATITATAVLYLTSASQAVALQVRARTAVISLKPTSAQVGQSYSAYNNNAILAVTYVGYQPTDSDLPQLTASTGTVGHLGTLNNGVPTTTVTGLSTDGFVMAYDYSNTHPGTDTITLGSGVDSCTVTVAYSPLTLTPQVNASTASEYATSASFGIPVTISGGLAPYTTSVISLSNSRFTASGANITVNPSLLSGGTSYNCSVGIQVSDSSGQTAVTSGTLEVTIRSEQYMTASFNAMNWALKLSTGPQTASFIPDQQGVVVGLGHAPYQFYVDSVTLPNALASFVTVSASKRVLAIQYNESATSAQVPDVDASLNPSGTFTVPAVNAASAPAHGTYTITTALRVVDAKGFTTSGSATITVTIS